MVPGSLGLAPTTPLNLTVARFSEQKGHRLLIDAMPAILASCPQARFVWVGEGPLVAELRAIVRVRGLAPAVCFLGRRDDVPALLATADVLVQPSLFEGLPLVVLEAGAAGLPVVATPDIGAVELVQDGVTGLLVPHRDPAAVARALDRLLADPSLGHELGGNMRREVEQRWSVAVVVPRWETLFDEVIPEREGKRAGR